MITRISDHILRYKNVKSLYGTPKTNITNTVLYASIFKKTVVETPSFKK